VTSTSTSTHTSDEGNDTPSFDGDIITIVRAEFGETRRSETYFDGIASHRKKVFVNIYSFTEYRCHER